MNKLIYIVSLLTIWLCCGCGEDKSRLFTLITAEDSAVHFNNIITVNDSMNILDYEYLYNGGGVGVGDFNNDGLDDLFFSGNMVDNALYLNQGDFNFLDISESSGTQSAGQWSSGISVVDVNADGLMDIYVCNNTHVNADLRKNNLFINTGVDKNGIPKFVDEAASYGLDDDSYSVNSAFFDYDNDGDLDVIIIINEMEETRFPGVYQKRKKRKESYQRIDRLYENVFSETKGHAEFVDVSEKAGINVAGFSLGLNITDINQDGWQDIYITNDFLSNDLLYINQKDGSFQDQAKHYFKHTSQSAMGNDVADINNDGLVDVIALDMLPEDNYRQKKLLGPNNYTFYINNERYGYTYQYVRNTLQLNQGLLGKNQEPLFSEIALMSGVSATDWSWTPMVADFNNDGYKDIIITNGFPKDVTDHDFVDYKADVARFASKEMMLKMIPEIKSKNCGFLNNGDLTFENVTDQWGLDELSFSNGAVFSDLDNDGDLDIVINNIDSPAFIYRNNNPALGNNYIQLKLKGTGGNINALGTKISIFQEDQIITYVHSPYRGYLSTHTQKIHIGLGSLTSIHKMELRWPNGTLTTLENVDVNQELTIDQSGARDIAYAKVDINTYFKKDSSFVFKHEEGDFVDYNIQALLPHKLSEFGPGLSVGDIDANGLDDIYVSGSTFRNGHFLMQYEEGQFQQNEFLKNDPDMEELGTLLFDADGDLDLDLYIVSGSYEKSSSDSILIDRFYENVNHDFIYRPEALPSKLHNGLNVKAADYDRDGDLDLVIGGRINHGKFPEALDSYIYQNNSDENRVQFSDVTATVAEDLLNIGMVTDMLWTDFDQDGWVDLIVLAELSGVKLFKNIKGRLDLVESNYLDKHKGFWNTIQGGDVDNDGDIDYVLGNRGLNQFNPISETYPFKFYVNDFDKNGSTDVLPFSYFKNQEGQLEEFPFMSRLDFTKEINSARRKFPTFESYATAGLSRIITDSTLQKTDVYEANFVYSCILKNEGSGNFVFENLPVEAQLAPVYGILLDDLNQDGLVDITLAGNDFGNEIFYGRQDALNGVCLIAKDDGSYTAIPPGQSGYIASGNVKSLVTFYSNSQLNVVTAQNRGHMLLHKKVNNENTIIWSPENTDHIVNFQHDGKNYIRELYHGAGSLSQSSRKINLPPTIKEIKVKKFNGTERRVSVL